MAMDATTAQSKASVSFQSAKKEFNEQTPAGRTDRHARCGRDVARDSCSRWNRAFRRDPRCCVFYRKTVRGAQLDAWGMHRVAQHANAGDADFDDVTGDKRADPGGRASGDHVAGNERHHARDITHQKSYGIHHERSPARLAARAIDVRLNEHIRRIEMRLDMRTDGAKRIEAFGA